ncbi:LOW QUALITY PROTEIN: FAD-dependent oxidoreductase domain-containing protein 1-like [Pollicipes pollicipes]|uniref:FAD-dependent oxidoreductase domain-containing protein 1-like n=1 Tax=Pollicipes pollicipes TaxID=41117 RepID=UPI00188593C5|nr:FAD-dependent oxidoreductase domain-containing protein 1-like [Pollicipes pollicipes]XP_037074080.1 LOW QUALITY PROTEIN: FAD-dependent oxidoreductase domain-containing protein 1-like [Pollicipes pollicipes]
MRFLWEGHQSRTHYPSHCDVCIIGGGIMGSAIAFWLKLRAGPAVQVVVVERDSTYRTASTPLSVGGLRQQFSLPENIQMSMFSAQFLRNVNRFLAVEGEEPPDVQFHPQGYLMCAAPDRAARLEENYRTQIENGAKVELMTPARMKERFPWVNTDGVALACHGQENEGWFDPHLLLRAFRRKATHMGVEYVEGEAAGFESRYVANMQVAGRQSVAGGNYVLDRVVVRQADGEVKTVKAAVFVTAAGANTAEVARLAGIGEGEGLLAMPVPVEPRKRYVYFYHSPDGPGLDCPLLVDPTGTYFRREGLGGHYICGKSPTGAVDDPEPDTGDLEVDHGYFQSHIWANLAARVPSFENLKVKSSWAGFYDYNTLDQNAIIGPHPYHHNMFLATGFSGHGIQQAPAVGRAISEHILDGEFRTIDLTRMGFKRVLENKPLLEQNIV